MSSADVVLVLERRILGGLTFHDGAEAVATYNAVAQVLTPPLARWFQKSEHRLIAETIDMAAQAGAPTTWPSIAERLQSSPSERATTAYDEVSEAFQLLPGEAHRSIATMVGSATQLRAVHRQREALTILREQATAIQASGTGADPAEAVAVTIGRLHDLAVSGEDVNVGQAVDQALADGRAARDRRSTAGDLAVTWGIAELDNLIPLEPGRMVVLAAAPKCGKTSLAMCAALATAERGIQSGAKVAMATLEMTSTELAGIMVSRALGLRTRDLRQGRLDAEQEGRVQAIARQWMDRDALYLRDATGEEATCSAIIAWLRHRQQISGGRLALGIVDYLQLLAPEEPRWTEYQRVTAHSRALKLASTRMGIPILVLCQLSRDGRRDLKDRRTGKINAQAEPGLSDLRGSGSIEQDADAVVFLHSPDQASEDEEHRTVRARVAVSRYCTGNRSTDLSFHGPSQSFTALRAPHQAERLKQPPQASEDLFNEQH